MILFALSGILIGTVLGTSFTVDALIPAMICAVIVGGTNSTGGDVGFPQIIEELILLFVFLQIGYLFGAALQSIRSIHRAAHASVSK